MEDEELDKLAKRILDGYGKSEKEAGEIVRASILAGLAYTTAPNITNTWGTPNR